MKTDADTPIEEYLAALRHELRWRGVLTNEILLEIEDHLLEAVAQEVRCGVSEDEAQRRVLGRFGSARQVAEKFSLGRIQRMQKVLLGLAVVVGVAITWVDSRPGWDDTGITVISLLLASGLLSLLGFRKPWLLALAMGLWLPLYEGILLHDPKMGIVLIFPLIGAYAGWGVHKVINRTLHPA